MTKVFNHNYDYDRESAIYAQKINTISGHFGDKDDGLVNLGTRESQDY